MAEPRTTDAVVQTYEPPTTTGTLFATSWLFLVAAIGLVGYGLNRMFAYSDADKIVGGDAYNYQILATRGVGFVAAGIASACIAATLVLAAIYLETKSRQRSA